MTEKERFKEWLAKEWPSPCGHNCDSDYRDFYLSRIATALERIADGNEQRRKDLHAADEKMAKSAEALQIKIEPDADERLQKLRGLF